MTKVTKKEFMEHLKNNGYAIPEGDIDSSVDYINMTMAVRNDYGMDTWIADTITNYPNLIWSI